MLFSDKKVNPREYSPLPLAYIGDSVYDLFVRTKIIEKGNRHVTDMHKEAVKFVKAHSQAESIHAIEDKLTEDEVRVLKWGRNAKSTPPKNADVTDYRYATGFEALIGYLYVSGEEDRLKEVLNMAYDALCE